MCGIIGNFGPKSAEKVLIEGLKRLEYRGYDSPGICVILDGKLVLAKRKGKIRDLQAHLPRTLAGNSGIGHLAKLSPDFQ
jgi:glucosamine--fructose-6-phosphate aminotransferase (isomerizing)